MLNAAWLQLRRGLAVNMAHLAVAHKRGSAHRTRQPRGVELYYTKGRVAVRGATAAVRRHDCRIRGETPRAPGIGGRHAHRQCSTWYTVVLCRSSTYANARICIVYKIR